MYVWVPAGSRQYCRYTKSPLGITPLKEIWESPQVNENLTSVGLITVDYQQTENDNIAYQIHGFTTDYGKFILINN